MNSELKKQEWAGLLIVRPTGDAENCLEGGYTFLHTVLSCNVPDDVGELVYDMISFPAVPYFGPPKEASEKLTEPKLPRGPIRRLIRNMRTIDDEVIEELRERGVEVITLEKLAPTTKLT